MSRDNTRDYEDAVYIWHGQANGKHYAKLGITGTVKLLRKELPATEYAKRCHEKSKQRVEGYIGDLVPGVMIHNIDFDVEFYSFYSSAGSDYARTIETVVHRNLRALGYTPVPGKRELYELGTGDVLNEMFAQVVGMLPSDTITTMGSHTTPSEPRIMTPDDVREPTPRAAPQVRGGLLH